MSYRQGASLLGPGHATDDESRALSQYVCDSVTEYAIFTLAPDGSIVTWNPGAERTFGYTASEILGCNFAVIFTDEDVALGAPDTELRIAAAEGRVDRDAWHVRKDGTRFWGTNTVQPLADGSGQPLGFTKIVRDTTEQYKAALALRQSEERFRLLVDSVDEYAIFMISAEGTITLWNAGAQRTFGYRPHEIVGASYEKLFTEEDVAAGIPGRELDDTRSHDQIESERWQVRKDGSRFLAQRRVTQLKAEDSAASGFSVTARDITVRKATELTMWDQAFHDKLTGLANRSLFLEHLQHAISRAKRRPPKQFAVLVLDLDDFKSVNDEFGHILADGLLMHVAHRLRECVRPEDIVARIGGDEFTVLLGDVDGSAAAVELAARIHAAFVRPFSMQGVPIKIAASIGVAMGVAKRENAAEAALRDADVAMYEAKAQGRGRTVIFDDGMRTRVAAQHQLATDLRHAVDREEFFLEYQPILDLHAMRLAGFEALVRWQHPSRGVLPPGHFIPTAEQTGSIIPIDRWVLRTACRQMYAWQLELPQAGDLTMSVNLSANHFAQDDLCRRIARTLGETHLRPHSLNLEITESTLMEKSERVLALLADIRALDVEIQVDDFGTGYSSLSYLRLFPVSAVKVDRTFIKGMDAHEDRSEMVRAIVTMAHNLRLNVVAEGIETAAELSMLQDLACECGQGFLLSHPLSAETAREFIASHA